MKSLTSSVLGVFALSVAAGCSSTKITKTHPMDGKEKIPKAKRIYDIPLLPPIQISSPGPRRPNTKTHPAHRHRPIWRAGT